LVQNYCKRLLMTKRYFENVSTDGQESALNTPYEFWKDKVFSILECISQNMSSIHDDDLYTGTTGIAYMFYHLSISDKFKNDGEAFLNKAIAVLRLGKSNFDHRSLCQFVCGDAGVNAVKAAIYHQVGNDKMTEMYLQNFKKGLSVCKPIDFFKHGGDELFVGRTGYLYGVLWLEKILGRKIIDDQDVNEICLTIIESGRRYSKRNRSIFPLMYSYYNTEYLGEFY